MTLREILCVAGFAFLASTASRAQVAGEAHAPATIAPAGNAGPTLSLDVMQIAGTAAHANEREFGQTLSFTSAYGQGGTSGNDKVTSYRSMVAKAGTADAWTDNILFSHATDAPINTHGIELDYNMLSSNRYGGQTIGNKSLAGGLLGDGVTPFSGNSAWGMMITGVSTQAGTITGAYGCAAAGSHKLFQHCFASSVGPVQDGFMDASNALVAFRAAGANVSGLDLSAGSFSGAAIKMADGQKLCFKGADACLYHAGGKLYYDVGGVHMMSIADATGNAIFKGTVTADGIP